MTVALSLAPVALGLLLLWLGRYPGEERILALRAGAGRPRGGESGPAAAHCGSVALPRGGRLIASALAGRAPPALRPL